MATRLLLTFLALLASLAAQISPAQARVRVGGESEIGLSLQSVKKYRAAAVAAISAAGVPDGRSGRNDCAALALRPSCIPTATVQLGIDRARE